MTIGAIPTSCASRWATTSPPPPRDAAATPAPRRWGSTQNLGNFVDDDRPKARRRQRAGRPSPSARHADGDDADGNADGDTDGVDGDGDDDEAPNYGFGFWQEPVGFVGVPILKWFSTKQFPFFFQPFALDTTRPSSVLFYACSGAGSKAKLQGAGIYRIDVPYGVVSPDDVPPPSLEVATHGDVYELVAGGITHGRADASVLVAMNDTALMYRSAATHGEFLSRPLPTRFAAPIVFEYDAAAAPRLNPP